MDEQSNWTIPQSEPTAIQVRSLPGLFTVLHTRLSLEMEMERLTKRMMLEPGQWQNIASSLRKDNLVWVADEQISYEENIEPREIGATLCIVEEVWTRGENNEIFGVIVHDIIHGERGSFGIHPRDVVQNATKEYQKHFSAGRIQRRFRTFMERRRRVLRALALVQPVAKAWYVSPNNPRHQIRMRAIAEKWGMKY
jgi:hypothetical protein